MEKVITARIALGLIFGRDLTSSDLRDGYRDMLGDMVVSYLVTR